MTKVRIGIVGLGNMGASHARNILASKISRLELTALADAAPARLEPFPGVPHFASAADMIASGTIDALLIATPHFDHTVTGIAALKAGLHVLVEKPISVHKADAEQLIGAARRRKKLVFAAMFNQRTDLYYQKIRDLVRNGELGELRRVNWIITNWFRPDAYYGSSAWRATWKGEGGGVLLNQCPHNLDLFQWMFGLPRRVRAFCGFGRYHKIEVEDDVTAYFEFKNGATGVFITSTGEAPGTNRLEITGERGRVVFEDDKLTFIRNEVPMSEFSRTSNEPFGRPVTAESVIPVAGHGGQHNEILQNFVDAILDGASLLSPAVEGIHSVELANAMLLSAWTNKTIELPMNSATYARQLQKHIKESKFVKKLSAAPAAPADLSKSVRA